MPVNCVRIYEQKGTFLMLVLKVIYDKINMPKSMPWQQKTTNLGLDTVKLTAAY
jgi:hypothetical protein